MSLLRRLIARPAAALLVCTLVAGRGARADEAPPPPAGAEGKVLTVCAVPDSMPRMGRDLEGIPRGLDIALAERLARLLGRPVEFHWCASPSCSWSCLPARRCDVVLGQPRDSGPPRDVAWSVPYAGTGFGLVVPRGAEAVRSLADLQGKRIGVVAGTVPLSEKDHTVVRFKTREELLDRFASAKLDAAFLDADFAAWYLHTHDELPLGLVSGFVPRERWDMALAVRSNDGALLVALNRALGQLAESGEIRKIYAEYGVPFRAPHGEPPRREAAPNTWQQVRQRGELVVSMDPANLPYSSAREARPGFDVELARALAARLGVKLRLEWLDIQRETALGELLERRCDLVLGAAVDPNAMEDDAALAGKVLYSRPYYGTGYLLVRRQDGPPVKTLEELKGPRSQRLGTEAGSVADYGLRQRGFHRRLYRNQLATLKALGDGDLDAAYLWANVGWTLHASPEFRLEIVPGYVPVERWNIAVAMAPGDLELKQHVDAALAALAADGTVARTLASYHVPYFPPFPEAETRPKEHDRSHGHDHDHDHGHVHDQRNAGAPIRHAVADRGREPQMQRVQGSRHAYEGLARVRSAGALVVGLDQNNLPFSTAHPEPTGLDYEIAGLLAEQLGVSLRVYWAYSAHDSYASKLAARKQCDVILGITPDDRFAGRVLYSRPYALASYRLVVRAGAEAPPESSPVGVEEGVAIRGPGPDGRKVVAYPSLEAILADVAEGKRAAGYVVATRGAWLAHERWPGRLQLLPGSAASGADRFPLVAAVRKSDRDLKDAIDRAWDELERSGRLARAFERWHVPFEPEARP